MKSVLQEMSYSVSVKTFFFFFFQLIRFISIRPFRVTSQYDLTVINRQQEPTHNATEYCRYCLYYYQNARQHHCNSGPYCAQQYCTGRIKKIIIMTRKFSLIVFG